MSVRHDFTELLDVKTGEIAAVIVVAGLFSFGLTFRMWGTDGFDAAVGLSNLLFVFACMVVVVALHEFGHKLAGAFEGYHVTIRTHNAGLVVSAFVILYSQGLFPLVTPNLVDADSRPDLRMRSYRPHGHPLNVARIALGGLVGSVAAVTIFKVLSLLTGFALFDVVVLGAVLHMFFSLVPFELLNLLKLRYFQSAKGYTPGDGLHVFWWSGAALVCAIVFTLLFGGVALLTGTVSVVAVLVMSLLVTWAYSRFVGS